ncbi:MAG: substrate-binding domain-containing protein [Betaproteobacteria bacterium]
MRLSPALGWTLGDPPVPVDPRLLPLLIAVADRGSLAAAVLHCRLSYRGGWGLLRAYERTLGAALVAMQRGRGASLTPLGAQWVERERLARERLRPVFSTLAADLGAARTTKPVPRLRLRIAASHDFALAALRERLAPQVGLELDVSFMGSLHALEEFAAGAVAMAGFHVPLRRATRGAGVAPAYDVAPFAQRLRVRRDRLVRLVEREQGLILPRGNPARVRSFRDIAARRLKFLNRQRGSGTRLLVDSMLAEEAVSAAGIAGYESEEFTHAAVAATVASGGADAGFGLRAAADEYGLAFVPLMREAYFLAVRSSTLQHRAPRALIALLQSAAFGACVQALPGYGAAAPGTVVTIDALQERARR